MNRSSEIFTSLRHLSLMLLMTASLSASGVANGGAVPANPNHDVDVQTRSKEGYDNTNAFEKSSFEEKATVSPKPLNTSNAEVELKANQAQLRDALQKQMNNLLLENAEINRKRIQLLESDKRKVFWTQSLVIFLIVAMLAALVTFWRIHASNMLNRGISALSNTLSNFQDSFFNFVDTTQLATNSSVSSFQMNAEFPNSDAVIDFDLNLNTTNKRDAVRNKTTNIASDYFVEELDNDMSFEQHLISKTGAAIKEADQVANQVREGIAKNDEAPQHKTTDEFFAVKGYVDSWLRVYQPSDSDSITDQQDKAPIEASTAAELEAKDLEKAPDSPAIAAKKAYAAKPASPRGLLAQLDSCRANNDAETYQQVYREIKKLFNLKLEPWEMLGTIEQKQLSDFPHIINKILELWHSDEVEVYLERLLSNSRINPREGFDLPIYQKLEDLLELARTPERPRDLQQLKKIERAAFLFVPLPVIDQTINQTEIDNRRKTLVQEKFAAKAEPALKIDDELSYRNKLNSNRSLEAMITPEIGALDVDSPHAPTTSSAENAALEEPSPINMQEDKFLLSPFEVRIKLAVAYTEMGDSEGAILLLEEVIDDAPPGQRKHAERLLKYIQDKKAGLDKNFANHNTGVTESLEK